MISLIERGVMIHDAVDIGNEVRKQYVPHHIQKLEARKSDEVLLFSSSDDDLKIVVPSENTSPIIEPELVPGCKTESK